MLTFRLLSPAMVLFVAGLCVSSSANSQRRLDLEVINLTNETIGALYATYDSDGRDFGGDLIPSDTLEPGSSIFIDMSNPDDECVFDFEIEFSGGSVTVNNFDACDRDVLRIRR